MFEAQPEAGGMLRYGIPEYRLPKDVLDLEINQILDLGVELSTNVQLGRDFTVTSLKQGGYDAIFLGLGAWDSSKMRVQDEDSPGVLAGIEFLKQFGLRRKIDIHGRVLVVGGGNTAIDCARTALRLGVADVRILYRRTRKEMPANEMEIVEAEHEGVKMDFLVAPVRVLRGENGRVAGRRVHPHGAGRARRRAAAAAPNRFAAPSSASTASSCSPPSARGRAFRSSWTGGSPTSSPSASR